MVLTFRFEYFENVINKHHLSKCDWKQAAKWGFMNNLNNLNTWSVASTSMIDADTVEIVKRRDVNKSFMYKNFGLDQTGFYERVIINRKDNSVAVDRMDSNWWISEPFLGQRDLFYVDSENQEKLTFVRHNFWLHKIYKVPTSVWSNLSAMSYRKAFKAE